jgi:putative transposase
MANRLVEFVPGEYYHIYNRGVDKREIFNNNFDYERFIILLYLANSKLGFQIRTDTGKSIYEYFDVEKGEDLVDVCCYCLMPNHFHILVKEKTDGGISKFLQKLKTSYCSYYNKKNARSGALFETAFKAEIANSDRYLKYLFSYIHLNPIKLIEPKWKEIGIKNINKAHSFLNTYKYSSFTDNLGIDRKESKVICESALPEYFEDIADIKKEIIDWLNFKNIS